MYSYKKIVVIFFVFLFFLLFLSGASYFQKSRFKEMGWFGFQIYSRVKVWKDKSLWLNDYQATIQAKKIDNVKNLSGLTYNAHSNTLYTITNKQPEIIELSLDGEVIRRIDASIFKGPEAIEYIDNNTYVVADEVEQRISLIKITDETQTIKQVDTSLSLVLGYIKNKSVQGVTYNPNEKELLIAKEKNPIRLYSVKGFYNDEALTGSALLVIGHKHEMEDNLFFTEISGLGIDKRTGHYLALSHESKILLELDKKGNIIGSLSLYKGQNGLTESVFQAEGIAIDANNIIYIVSEPNLFYKFQKTDTP